MNLAQLKDQTATIKRAMRASLDRAPGKLWTRADDARFDADLVQLSHIEEATRALEAQAERDQLAAYGVTELDVLEHHAMFAAWARGGDVALSERQRRIANTMSTTTGSQGGFTVITDTAKQLGDYAKAFSAVRQVAETIYTPSGGPLGYPTSDGTGETGELIAENVTATAADPTFAQASLATYKYSSKIFTVPLELLQDSNLDLEAFILQRAAARIGRTQNAHFTTGTGTGQPTGFAGAATVGKTGTTGQTTAIIHDDVIDLIHSVDPAYRHTDTGGAVFMTSDTGAKMLRKLKDTQGRPIYLPDEAEDAESIMGYPLVCNNDVAVPAASARSVFFGNFFRAYKVRDALQVALFRFGDSVYITKGQLGFLALARSGGNLVDTVGVKAYVHSAS